VLCVVARLAKRNHEECVPIVGVVVVLRLRSTHLATKFGNMWKLTASNNIVDPISGFLLRCQNPVAVALIPSAGSVLLVVAGAIDLALTTKREFVIAVGANRHEKGGGVFPTLPPF